jgi:hypothetical protein
MITERDVDQFDGALRPDALTAVLRGLIDLLADPQAARALLDKLAEAHAEANAERAALKQLKAEQDEIRAAMAAEQDAHRRVLSHERLVFNDEINARRNEVTKAEYAVKELKRVAEEDARQADQLRGRWQKKVDAIDAGLRA